MLQNRILIAEDDEDLRDALQFYLSKKGYDVSTVDDGVVALDSLKSHPYDLLLTDIIMPGMSGSDLLLNLKTSQLADPPAVIVMTGLEKGDDAVKAIKAGVSFFLRKPLIMDELEAAVATAIDRRRLDLELKAQYAELDKKVEARTRELTLLNRFSSVVNGSLDLNRILGDAVDYLAESMESDAAWIYMLNNDTARLELMASTGLSEDLKEAVRVLDVSSGYSGRTFRDGGAFIYSSLPGETVPIGGTVAEFGYRSAMHAAIKSGDKVLGSMGVASLELQEFQDSHLQLLASFGNQIGVAIEKINLYESETAATRDLQKKVNQLVILNELGSLVRVSKTLEEAARSVVTCVGQGLGFQAACLWLMGRDGKTLTLAACHGGAGFSEGCVSMAESEFINSLMAEPGPRLSGTARLCDGLRCDPEGAGGRAVCCAVTPLVARNPHTTDMSCWEHFGCSEKECPAFLNTLACWMVEDSCVRRLKSPGTLLDKIEICKGCEVYTAGMKGRVIGFMCVEKDGCKDAIGADELGTLGVYANSVAASLENIRLLERLIKDERFIDSILFNMSSGLMVTDNDGVVKMINYTGSAIFKRDHGDLLDQNIVELFPEARRLVSVDESHVGMEVMINGIPVGYSNSYQIGPDGRPDGVIVVFRDLSDIKKLQDRIRAADRFAAIGKVAAGVAHEIRNPLFGITSVAQILARETAEDSPLRQLIDAMLSETSRLNTLVEELLLYGRPTKAALAPTDVRGLMEDVLDFHKAAIEAKGIRLSKDFDPHLPQVKLDPHQMRQVFLNILYNALDAISKDGEIRLSTKLHDKSAVIRISDTGTGIPQDEIPKVFDLFFTTKEKGTGLGLAICRKIVEDHGGTVTLQSLTGKGTTVEIALPLGTA
jgi:signal transduction histidine kinase/DNA-binding response OmpR family regulator